MKTWERTVMATVIVLLICGGIMVTVADHFADSVLSKKDAPLVDILYFFGIYFAMSIPVVWVFSTYLCRQAKKPEIK